MTVFTACAILSWSLSVGSAHGESPTPLDVADLQRRVASLAQRVDELAPGGPGAPGLDSLHFGWFDRPYARATLATLVKTSAALQREVRLRNAGNGAIPAATLGAMLHWTEDAVDRVLADEPDPRFRPHRVRVLAGEIVQDTAPPLFAFLDRATATRRHPAFGDLDLLAALGQRVYARTAVDLRDEANFHTLVRRAEFLGMAVVDVLPTATDVQSAEPVAASPSPGALRVQLLTIAALLTRAAFDSTRPVPAVRDAVAGEPWPSRVARRALTRGVTGRSRCVVGEWSAGPNGSTPAGAGPPIAAAMWLDALDGVSLAVAGGWRDLRDGSASTSPSVFTRPDEIETFARTSLDILRFADAIRSVEAASRRAGIAIAVSPDAINPRDANRWDDWIEPFFAVLVERQIPFDIVSDAGNRQGLAGGWHGPRLRGHVLPARYLVVFPLRRSDAADLNFAIVRLERELATVESLARRRTVRELDGSFPRDLFVRSGDSSDGRDTIAVVNLSTSPRELRIIGGGTLPRLREILSGTLMIGRDGRFTIGPWQSRLFAAP
jgi:hypothetical protein